MEIEKYKITWMLNEEKHEHGDIYYLLHGSITWESENNLSSLNSSLVKNYICSNSKKMKKNEERDKHMHQRFDIDDRERIISADNIKEECFVDQNDERYPAHTGDKHFTCDICNK